MGKPREKRKVNKDAWLNTYADMITLILVFFVLLYSMSTIDQEKYRLLVKAFTSNPETLEQIAMEESKERGDQLDVKPGAPDGGAGDGKAAEDPQSSKSTSDKLEVQEIQDLEQLYQYLKQYVEENNLSEAMQVSKGQDMVYIRFMSTLFFEPDKAVLKTGGTDILDNVGKALHQVEDEAAVIRVDGHTAESAGSGVNDRDLSTSRANVVLKYLEGRYIADPSKLVAGGYGRYRPIAPNDTEANMAKNRRVEILLSKTDQIQAELDKIYKQTETTVNSKEK